MVIYDGHYVGILDEEARYSDPDLELPDRYKMSDAQYKIDLFGMRDGALGQLRLYFPNRSRVLWKDSLWLLAASLFFTLLILFAFSYTVYVILRQKKVSDMKNDFINNMTHEFKTPIATISLATDSLTSDKIIKEPGKVRRFARIITQENRRMLNQVEKVLQMALIDQRDFGLQVEKVPLHELISEAVDYIRLQVEKRGGTVQMKLDARQDVIKADRTHVSNIIHNLLDNANKYSSEVPKIQVETKNVSDGVEIRVIDHGIGMTREARKKIFDKFFRVYTGNIHDVKGFGLGLSYVKAIVTAHEGSIDVESEPGKGSTFIVFLPFNE
jgi:two-component system phosphate regulon sensor histidine kinase PhoR